MSRKQLLVARVLFVLYLIAVTWLCFGNFQSLPDVDRYIWGIPTDKFVHFGMFLPFPILAYFAFDRYSDRRRTSVLRTLAAFAAGALVAALTEYGQARLTTWRSGDANDLKADLLALAAGTVFILLLDFRKQNRTCADSSSC